MKLAKLRLIEEAIKILDENGIKYILKNNNLHFIITSDSNRYDFWPTHGKFMINGIMSNCSGIKTLIKIITEKSSKNKSISLDKDIMDMDIFELRKTIIYLCEKLNEANDKKGGNQK